MFILFEITIAFGTIFVFVYLYITYYAYNYFKRKGIPYLKPTFPWGNGWELLSAKKHAIIIYKEFYDKFKKMGAQLGGIYIFTKPTYVLVHPEMIRTILIKDFAYFNKGGGYYNEEVDPLSANMLNFYGEKWKNIRSKVTTIFTSGKIKHMFDLIKKATEPFESYLDDHIFNKKPIEAKTVFTYYTVDTIGSCAFSLEFNSFIDSNHQFAKMGRRALQKNCLELAKTYFAFTFPNLATKLRVKLTTTEVENFFYGIVRKMLDFRKKTGTKRNDFMQLMIGLMESNQITFTELVAETFLIYVGGFETSATTGAFTLYELAGHQEVQEKARKEVMEVLKKHAGELTYEAIQDMKYVGQVIDETLRKHAPSGILIRHSVKDYKLPNTDIIIEQGTRIVIPAYALHYDPDYFPDPEIFNPERFNDDNKRSIIQLTYLPFGDGPRNCPGPRFGMIMIKVGLARLLSNYRLKLNPKTKVPLEYNTETITLSVKGGIWLDVEKI